MKQSNKVTISIRIEPEQIEYLKYLSRFRSMEKDGCTYTDLIRDAVEEKFPIPEDFNAGGLDLGPASGVFHK